MMEKRLNPNGKLTEAEFLREVRKRLDRRREFSTGKKRQDTKRLRTFVVGGKKRLFQWNNSYTKETGERAKEKYRNMGYATRLVPIPKDTVGVSLDHTHFLYVTRAPIKSVAEAVKGGKKTALTRRDFYGNTAPTPLSVRKVYKPKKKTK